MENWTVLFGIVGLVGGLVALADRLIKRGREEAGGAFSRMADLAGELRTELTRKTDEFRRELDDERKECDDRIRRLREDVMAVQGRLKAVEDVNGL